MEHSADRAGLIACGDIKKAVSCMIKLRSEGKEVDKGLVKRAIRGQVDLEEDDFLGELLSTHPDLDERVKEIVRYSRDEGIGFKMKE
jgi:Zn-dependent protease with chaperone function